MVERICPFRETGVEGAKLASSSPLTQIDKNNDEENPWLPCPPDSWCAHLTDRWPASMVNPQVCMSAHFTLRPIF